MRWVVDRNMASAERPARPARPATASIVDEVLREDSVEAVAIAAPDANHHELTEAALRAGERVLVEKPIASGQGLNDAS